jgi:WD40 repeat protein
MTLLQGPQVLEDAASLHDVGVVDGAMLTVILASKYNLLVAMQGGDMELWNHEGKVEHTFLKDCDGVQDVAFSPDNNFVLSVEGLCVKLWQVDSQDCMFIFGHDSPVTSAIFSPTGTTVLSTQRSHDTKLWSTTSGRCLRSLLPPDRILGRAVTAFTPGGPMVLNIRTGIFTMWNMGAAAVEWVYHHRDLHPYERGGSECFSRCGNLFFTVTLPCNAMDVWSVSGRTHYWRFEEPKAKITYVAFSPDGWRVLAVTSRGIVRVWSLGRGWASWTLHSENVSWAAFAPDGVQVVTISRFRACLWRTDCQQFRVRLPEGDVSKAFFAPDGACVLLTGGYGTSLWNANGKGDCLFYVDKEDIRAMAFSHMRQ